MAGREIHCTGLEVEARGGGWHRLIVQGKGYPAQLRQELGMGSDIVVVRVEDGEEKADLFIVQDAVEGTEEPDGSFRLVVDAVFARAGEA